jgi:hypothetical protein
VTGLLHNVQQFTFDAPEAAIRLPTPFLRNFIAIRVNIRENHLSVALSSVLQASDSHSLHPSMFKLIFDNLLDQKDPGGRP